MNPIVKSHAPNHTIPIKLCRSIFTFSIERVYVDEHGLEFSAVATLCR